MKALHRNNCRLCGRKQIELAVRLPHIPLPNYEVTRETALAAPKFPVDLYLCRDCGHVQQLDIPESVWDDYSYQNGQAKVMLDHFAVMAKKIIETYKPAPGSLIVDIGSNDGSFLRHFKNAGYKVVGVELVKEIAAEATANGIETVGDALSINVAHSIVQKHGNAAVVLAFNVFAHSDDLAAMARSIQALLAKDGIFVFEAQYLLDIVQRNLAATIFHEHLSHHSVKAMKLFLDQYFMEMFDVDRVQIQHGSIIGYCQFKGAGRPVQASIQKLLDLEAAARLSDPQTIAAFGDRLQDLRKRVVGLVADWKAAGASVAAYGAARSGPSLIAMLGLEGVLDYIVDDHPQKVGRYSPGDGVPVLPTAELLKRMPGYTLLLAWVPAQRIIEANQEYLRRGGKFVVLCPDFRIVQCLAEKGLAIAA